MDIYCQQLGDICQLEVVCAPFGRVVRECTLCDIYIYIAIDIFCQQLGDVYQLDICVGKLPMVMDIYCQQLGDICQFEVVCAPFGRVVRECTFCDIYTLLLIYSANK